MEINIDNLVKGIVEKLQTETNDSNVQIKASEFVKKEQANYPLSKSGHNVKSKSGKTLSQITYDDVIDGKLTHEDLKTNPETLLMQAEIAESAGKKQFADNLKRAAELVLVPDDEQIGRAHV